jgi:hypothetical protein
MDEKNIKIEKKYFVNYEGQRFYYRRVADVHYRQPSAFRRQQEQNQDEDGKADIENIEKNRDEKLKTIIEIKKTFSFEDVIWGYYQAKANLESNEETEVKKSRESKVDRKSCLGLQAEVQRQTKQVKNKVKKRKHFFNFRQ